MDKDTDTLDLLMDAVHKSIALQFVLIAVLEHLERRKSGSIDDIRMRAYDMLGSAGETDDFLKRVLHEMENVMNDASDLVTDYAKPNKLQKLIWRIQAAR